jgi:chromosome segregation ATPase
MRCAVRTSRLRTARGLAAAAWACLLVPAGAQQGDRERQQLKQMQLQLQHLQSENASLQGTLNEAQSKAKREVEDAHKRERAEAAQIAKMKDESKARSDELDGLRSNLSATSEKLATATSDIERLRKEVAERDEALGKASEQKRRDDAAAVLLQERLKLQTSRGDLCETRHAGLTGFSERLIAKYEASRLRLCEPVTGIWKVREEKEIQALRDQLYDYRLDVPVEDLRKP